MVPYDEAAIGQEIAVIGTLARELHRFLAGLPEAELGRQSACDAWTVREVAGHLTNRAERQIASMTRGRQGDAGPPAGFSAPAELTAMSAANAGADIAYTQALGEALLPTFERQYRELHALLAGFSGADWGCACWHPRRGTMPAREYVSQRIQELAVHDWDIRSAFDAAAELHPEARPVLLGMSAHWLRAAYQPGPYPPTGEVRYRFALTDAEAMEALVGPTGVQAGAGLPAGTADLTVECDANTYLLLAYGRLDLVGMAGGRLQTTGPVDLLGRFAEWMVGF